MTSRIRAGQIGTPQRIVTVPETEPFTVPTWAPVEAPQTVPVEAPQQQPAGRPGTRS